jgi:4-hydroxybenzoate polyprenyltransferase
MPQMAEQSKYIVPITKSPFWACVRITRPWNVLMVGVSMTLIRLAWIKPGVSGLLEMDFAMPLIIMMLLAASGNVINDYFDVAEDLVNKPRRALVGRVVSRRTALLVHHFMVGTAMSMALAISINWKTPTPFVWSAVVAGLLWLYSPQFKRRFLRGNIIVSLIVGQLPIWCTLGAFNFSAWHEILEEPEGKGLVAYALLSLTVTFLREVTKDLQDMTGDAASGYDTIPVRWGKERSVRFLKISHLCAWPMLISAAILASVQFNLGTESLIFLMPYAGATIQLFRKRIDSVSAWQKLTLGGGLAFLLFLV